MKYADEKGTKTQQWFPNEICMDIDLNRLGIQRYQNLTDTFLALMYQDIVDSVLNGLQLNINTLLTCTLKTGAALSFNGAYASDGVWGFVAAAGDAFSVVVPDDTAIAFTTADPTNPRIDVLEIRPIEIPYNSASRNFKDPITKLVNTAVINTSLEYGFEFQILEGTPAGSPSAPSKTAGWIKLAEVSIAATQTVLTQNDINDVRDSDVWDTEADTTILKLFTEVLESTSTGEGASKIGIEDFGMYYNDADVEAALHELGLNMVNSKVPLIFSQIGNDLNISGIGNPEITALTASRVAFIDLTNADLRTYDFDGTDWSQTGNDLNISTVGNVAIAALSSSRIAFIDTTNQDLRTYDFDGTDWSQTGNDLNIADVDGSPTITALTASRIAYIDSTEEDLRTYDFDGTNWSQTGNDLNIAGVTSPSITALLSSRIAYMDTGNDDLRTYDFDGTDWLQIGNDLNISGATVPAITTLTASRIAYMDAANQDLRTYDFDGTDWLQIGNDLNISGIGNMTIAGLVNNKIAFIDPTLEDLRTYQLAFMDLPPTPVFRDGE
jgi:uncharacterized protein YjbI with pentapeptide repeats